MSFENGDSLFYQGYDSGIILQPGRTYTQEPNGLTTAILTFACASSYASAASAILHIGGSGGGESNLFHREQTEEAGITYFKCTYHGATSTKRFTGSTVVRSFDILAPSCSGTYTSPTLTIESAVSKGSEGEGAPSMSVIGSAKIINVYSKDFTVSMNEDGNTIEFSNANIETGGYSVSLNFSPQFVSSSRQNYGLIDVVSMTYCITSQYG